MAIPTIPVTPANQAAMVDGQRSTYSATKVGLVTASSATDIFTITGSASKVVRITRVEVTATTTSATPAALDVQLVKRSTANSAGTSASAAATSYDSSNADATATVLSYTANPTTGTIVGTAIRAAKFFQTLATYTATDFPDKDTLAWDFGNRPSQSPTLRATTEVIAVNLSGASATTTVSFDLMVEWTESDT